MRLIDADALKKTWQHTDAFFKGALHPRIEDVIKSIDSAPTIEAEPIVRCKDCKHHADEEIGMVYCPNIVGGWVKDDWFCGSGERREDVTASE